MPIEFTCAKCGAGLKVLDVFAGKTILCPKCVKRTPVPPASGAPAPAAPVQKPVPASPEPAPAPAVRPPTPAAVPSPASGADAGTTIAFTCSRCGASLKALKSFAGKMIQCPKCVKKTAVPGPSAPDQPVPPSAPAAAAPEPPPASSVPAVGAPESVPKPAPELRTSAPVPIPAPSPAVAPPPEPSAPAAPSGGGTGGAAGPDEAVLAARLREQESQVLRLTRDLKAMEERLEVARLQAERAERDKTALADKKETDRNRLEAELAAHYRAEVEAARKTIAQLETQVHDATAAQLAARSAGGRTGAQIARELLDNPESAMTESETRVSNAVMADIAKSRFGRYLRMAILIHVVVLAVSSVPYIRYRLAERRAAAAAVAAGAEAPADAAEAAAAAPPAPAPVPAPETRQPDRADPRTNDAAPAAPAAASALEALPAPGEKPAATELDLGL